MMFHAGNNNKSQVQRTSGGQCLILSHSRLAHVLSCTVGWVRHDKNERRFQRCAELFPTRNGFRQGTPGISFSPGAGSTGGLAKLSEQTLAAPVHPTTPAGSSWGHRGIPSPGHQHIPAWVGWNGVLGRGAGRPPGRLPRGPVSALIRLYFLADMGGD